MTNTPALGMEKSSGGVLILLAVLVQQGDSDRFCAQCPEVWSGCKLHWNNSANYSCG